MSSDQCFKLAWNPPSDEHNVVGIKYCSSTSSDGRCVSYSQQDIESTYRFRFSYSGEQCVNSLMELYPSVYITSVLLSAIGPATLDLIIVPLAAPWLHLNSERNKFARSALLILRSLTFTVAPVLNANCKTEYMSRNLGDLTQITIERAITQSMFTLLVALTFGVAAPLVGAACALSSALQYVHHRRVISIACDLETRSLSSKRASLYIAHCEVPKNLIGVILLPVVLYLFVVSYGYADELVVAVSAISPIFVFAFVGSLLRWWQRRDFLKQDASSLTKLSMSLLGSDAASDMPGIFEPTVSPGLVSDRTML